MINRIKDLNDDCDIEKIMKIDFSDQNQPQGARGSEPLFFVSAELCDDVEIPPEEIKEVLIDDFDQKKSKVEDWDLLAHIEIDPPKEDGEDEGEADDPGAEAV